MTPVMQTRFGFDEGKEPPGNCWAACIASVLDLPLNAVPDEAKHWHAGQKAGESWPEHSAEMYRWLLTEHRIVLVEARPTALYVSTVAGFQGCYTIISGPSPRNPEKMHACVGLGNNIVHDPHPSGDGLVGDPDKEWWYELFLTAGALRR